MELFIVPKLITSGCYDGLPFWLRLYEKRHTHYLLGFDVGRWLMRFFSARLL